MMSCDILAVTPTNSKLVELTPVATPADSEHPMDTQEPGSQPRTGGGKESLTSPASSEQSLVTQQQPMVSGHGLEEANVANQGSVEEEKGRMMSSQDKRILDHKDKFPQVRVLTNE